MKKRTIASLGICALAIGAVIGVVGTQAAREVKADTVTPGWYITGSAKGDWKADETYLGAAEGTDKAVWRNVSFAADETFCLAYYNEGTGLDWDQAKRWAAVNSEGLTTFVDAADSDHNIKCFTAGTYNIYLNKDYVIYLESATPSSSSSSEASSSQATSSSSTPEVDLSILYLRGAAVGGWEVAEANKLVEHEGDKGCILNVTFAVGEFKIGNADWSKAWGWKYKNDDEAEAHVTVIGGAAANFEAGATETDNNIACKVAGAYDVYLTNNNYISIEPHSEATSSQATSVEPLEGNIYVGTANFGIGSKAYLYTWNSDTDKNAEYPGLEINAENYPTASCTNATNFNKTNPEDDSSGDGGIWEIPASVLKAKFIITIRAADYVSDEAEPHRYAKSGDIVSAANIYVAPGAAEAVSAAQAKVVKSIDDAIYAAADHSVCNVSKTTAETLVAAYDALTDKSAVDASTYWTYGVSISELNSETEPSVNVAYTALIAQLRSIADSGASSAWNVNSVTGNVTLIITVSVVTLGLGAAAALYLISKKRRVQQ